MQLGSSRLFRWTKTVSTPALTGRHALMVWGTLAGLLLATGARAEEKWEFLPPQESDPSLIAFWDFQESPGKPFTARGMQAFELQEMEGTIERVEDGVFGPRSARIQKGQWMRIPRAELGPLNIHGEQAQVTVVAWIKRDAKNFWQSIAGVWDETHKKRQYMMFLNARAKTDSRTMDRINCQNLVHGHISSVGGPTPGHKVCKTYASGGPEVPLQEWTMISMTYDGREIRAYVNGQLEHEEHFNPFPYPEGIYDGGEDGAEFTVGANHVAGLINNNRFGGLIGGLAIYNRALTAEEMAALVQRKP